MPPIFPLHFQGAVLRILPRTFFHFSKGLSPSMVFLSRKLQVKKKAVREVHAPHLHHITMTDSVWTIPVSFATTNGISFDLFSCGY